MIHKNHSQIKANRDPTLKTFTTRQSITSRVGVKDSYRPRTCCGLRVHPLPSEDQINKKNPEVHLHHQHYRLKKNLWPLSEGFFPALFCYSRHPFQHHLLSYSELPDHPCVSHYGILLFWVALFFCSSIHCDLQVPLTKKRLSVNSENLQQALPPSSVEAHSTYSQIFSY